jgi:uracil-DNA glycosylase
VVERCSFLELVAAVQACRRCPAMEGRRRVLGEANGRPEARVLFIAEAPGRLGAERTGVPMTSDQTGRRFSRMLALAGLARDEVFITNAALCNPQSPDGRNRAPSRRELDNCAGWLVTQLALVRAPVVVTLGAVALAALDRIARHGLTLRADAGRAVAWQGRMLVPLYHPSPRAGLSRSYARQDEDVRRLGQIARDLSPQPEP